MWDVHIPRRNFADPHLDELLEEIPLVQGGRT